MNGRLHCRFLSVSPSLSCVWSRQNLWPGKPGARALGGPAVGRPCLAPHPPASQPRLPVLRHLSSQLPISESLTCALRTNVVGCVMSLSSCLALYQLLPIILRDRWSHPGWLPLSRLPFSDGKISLGQRCESLFLGLLTPSSPTCPNLLSLFRQLRLPQAQGKGAVEQPEGLGSWGTPCAPPLEHPTGPHLSPPPLDPPQRMQTSVPIKQCHLTSWALVILTSQEHH